MNMCKICKHWYQDAKQTRLAGRGLCVLASTAYGERDDILTIANEDSKAIAIGEPISEFSTRIVTGRMETTGDFGCVQWEGK